MTEVVRASIPGENPNWVEWAEENVVFPSSVRSKNFKLSISPWIKEPVDKAFDLETRIDTLVKPVQSAGSTAGEIILLYWIRFWHGFIQYNWTNDKRAIERWESRIEGILKACKPVAELYELAHLKKKGEVDFGSKFFRIQGAFVSSNLDSDSVPLQINEEVHDWAPGHLKKARNRSTAVWNFKSIDISNAGVKGGQLDKALHDGTDQRLMVKCPGCGLWHYMQIKWDDKRPDLGGIRYDADGCRTGFLEYNYPKLRPTIHYQFPCGFKVHNEDIITRRALSTSCKYSEPRNKNAELSHRSYSYDSSSVDYIDWMTLIRDKHDALKARALGDMEPWRRYITEKECLAYDPEEVPLLNITTVAKGLRKGREGLPEPRLRLGALDRQQGDKTKGEFPYWWLAIRDVKWNEQEQRLQSRLVHESKCETDEQVISILRDHGVNPWQVVADSGDDTTHVYLFCQQYGIHAIKGGNEEFYAHKNGARRIFSPERPLCVMLNRPPNYPYISMTDNGREVLMPDPREPMFWLYSKPGIRERLHWMRTETIYETPEDVSDDYKAHQESEERVEKQDIDGRRYFTWIQHKRRNDQFVNEAYIAMQVDQAGMIIGEVQPVKTEKY